MSSHSFGTDFKSSSHCFRKSDYRGIAIVLFFSRKGTEFFQVCTIDSSGCFSECQKTIHYNDFS